MECSGAESTWELNVFEQLVVNEAQCPVYGQRRAEIQEIRYWRFHIESNFQFGGLIRVGNYSCRKDFDLWNENLARFYGSGDVDIAVRMMPPPSLRGKIECGSTYSITSLSAKPPHSGR